MYQIKSENIKNNVSEFTKLEALIQLNKNIENGHLIRQSMKYYHANVCDWVVSRRKKVSDIRLPISSFKDLFMGLKSKSVIQVLIKWIEETYHPTAFLTIQLPDKLKTERKDKALDKLRLIMAYFERQLLGREWHKHHLPFICFMEEGISGCCHFHILFNQGKFRPWHLYLALDNTIRHFDWPDYSIRLDIMNADKKKAIGYCLKEVKVNAYGHFNSDRFVFSSELFGLNHSTAMR